MQIADDEVSAERIRYRLIDVSRMHLHYVFFGFSFVSSKNWTFDLNPLVYSDVVMLKSMSELLLFNTQNALSLFVVTLKLTSNHR